MSPSHPTPSALSAVPPAAPPPLVLLDLLRIALQRRRWLVAIPACMALSVVVVGLLGKRSWTASAAMIANSSGANISRLAGLAAQMGMNMPSGQSGQSPDYYADVLRSDGLLRQLLMKPYTDTAGTTTDLATHLVPGETNALRRSEFALRRLRTAVSASVGLKTGIVRVSARLDDPELARQLVARAIEQLNAVNIASRQAMAAQEREFTDERVLLARVELRNAEDRLEAFLRGNRVFSGGPGLVLQEERLRREVSFRQQVMVGLAQALEQSRLEEVRSVPVLSVVEAPVRPALPDSRKLMLRALFAAVASGGALFALLLAMEWRRRFARTSPDAAAEVEHLAREAAADLRRPWRMLRRARTSDRNAQRAA